jgi:hypothetical protein
LTLDGSNPGDLPVSLLLKLFYRPSMVVRCPMTQVQEPPLLPRGTSGLFYQSSPLRALSRAHRVGEGEGEGRQAERGVLVERGLGVGGSPTGTPTKMRSNEGAPDTAKLVEWDSGRVQQSTKGVAACFQLQIQQLLSPSLSSSFTITSEVHPAQVPSSLLSPSASTIHELQVALESLPRYSSRKRHCVAILMLVLHLNLKSQDYRAALKVWKGEGKEEGREEGGKRL